MSASWQHENLQQKQTFLTIDKGLFGRKSLPVKRLIPRKWTFLSELCPKQDRPTHQQYTRVSNKYITSKNPYFVQIIGWLGWLNSSGQSTVIEATLPLTLNNCVGALQCAVRLSEGYWLQQQWLSDSLTHSLANTLKLSTLWHICHGSAPFDLLITINLTPKQVSVLLHFQTTHPMVQVLYLHGDSNVSNCT